MTAIPRIDRTRLRHTLGGNEGLYEALQSVLVSEPEDVVSGASAISLDETIYHSKIVSGGSAGSEDVNLGDGSDAVVGQRKLITLVTRTNGADVINLDHANMANSSGVQMTNCDLDAAGEFILVEWNGTKWQEVYSDATITV